MMIDIPQEVDSVRIAESVELLKQFIEDPAIEPLIAALEALKHEPGNAALLNALSETFATMNVMQGAVLIYAPYIGTIVTNNMSGDD